MFWWILATLCAFFVKGLCGFANTLVFTTILSFCNSNVNISPVELILGYPTNAILAWKERRAIKWRMCLLLAALVILGSIPGILFLKNADTRVIKVLFGFVIVLLGLELLLREKTMLHGKRNFIKTAAKGRNRKNGERQGSKQQSRKLNDMEQQRELRASSRSKAALTIIGVLSGILCGLYGVGALLGVYVSRVSEDSHSFKGNLCVVFFVENTLRVVLYVAWGIITSDILKQALCLVPVMLFGLWMGMVSGKVLDEKLVKKIVVAMLIVSGIALIINSLTV